MNREEAKELFRKDKDSFGCYKAVMTKIDKIYNSFDRKRKLIDEVTNLHPAYGTSRGWSWYVGGMRDTGDWDVKKLLDVTAEELEQFLIEVK